MTETPVRQTPNATSRFLNDRLVKTGGVGGSLWRQLRNAVGKYLPISASSDQVEDHIQEFFRRVIFRDAFAKRLQEGFKISDNDIVVFAIRSGFTDIRKWGQNPVTRVLYGARTERERDRDRQLGTQEITVRVPARVWNSKLVFNNPSEDTLQPMWDDILDDESSMTAQAVEDRIQFRQIWMKVERVLSEKKGQHHDRYVRVAQKKYLSGYTLNEIGESEELPAAVNFGLIQDVRKTLRKEHRAWKNPR